MTPEEMEDFAENNFSSFEGDSFYTGEGDDFLDFGGPNRSFATEQHTGRIFVVNITNQLETVEDVVLIPGYTWKPGDVGNNVLVDGIIKTVGPNNLSASGSPKTIKEFLSFISKSPTNCAGIRVSSNNNASQIEQQMIKRELSPFKDLESQVINLGAYTNEQAYKDKMVSVPTPNLILSAETQLILPVMPNSVCTVTFFCGGVLSTASALKRKREKAGSTIAKIGLGTIQKHHAIRQIGSAYPRLR